MILIYLLYIAYKKHTQNTAGYGDFGKLADKYSSGRQRFPQQMIDFALGFTNSPHQVILDLGCGTGLVTEQFAEKGHLVIGCDIDSRMIRYGVKQHSSNTAYKVGRAEKIPFASETFDLTTVFSAFHWFNYCLALKEIKRVLKPDGYLVVVNKNEIDDFKKEYRRIVGRFIHGTIPNIKRRYNPGLLLEREGFKDIQWRSFKTI